MMHQDATTDGTSMKIGKISVESQNFYASNIENASKMGQKWVFKNFKYFALKIILTIFVKNIKKVAKRQNMIK